MEPAFDQPEEDDRSSLHPSDEEVLFSLQQPDQNQVLSPQHDEAEELPSLSEGESCKEDLPSLSPAPSPPRNVQGIVSDSPEEEEEELPDLPSPSEYKNGLPKSNGVPVSTEFSTKKKLRKKKSDIKNGKRPPRRRTNRNNSKHNPKPYTGTGFAPQAENGNSHVEPVASTSSGQSSFMHRINFGVEFNIYEAETDTELDDFGTLTNYPMVVDVSSGSEQERSEETYVPPKRRRRPPVRRRRNQVPAQALGGPAQAAGRPIVGADVPIIFLSSDEESRARRRNNSFQPLMAVPHIPTIPIAETPQNPDHAMFEEPLEDAMRIRVTYKGQLFTFEGSRTWRIQRIREELSRLTGVPESELMLYSDKEVQLQDGKTLEFYDIQLGDSIDALRVQPEEAVDAEPTREDAISLKFQKEGLRKPLIITVNKSASLKQVRARVARLLNANEKRLWLSFDGEMIDLSSTPEDLDLEDGCCIDLYEKN